MSQRCGIGLAVSVGSPMPWIALPLNVAVGSAAQPARLSAKMLFNSFGFDQFGEPAGIGGCPLHVALLWQPFS